MRQRWEAKRIRREISAGLQDGDAMSVQSSESAATPLVSGGDLLSLEDSGNSIDGILGADSTGWDISGACKFLDDEDGKSDRASSWSEVRMAGREAHEAVPLVDGAAEDLEASTQHGGLPSSSLVSAAFRATDFQQFKYPWEKGRLRKVFGNDVGLPSLPSMKPTQRHFLPLEVVVDSDSSVKPRIEVTPMTASGALFLQAVKRGSNLSYLDERQEKREHVVRMWWTLLSKSKRHSSVGRMVLNEAQEGNEDDYAFEVLDASFSLKSPNTLLKRFYSIKGFYDWCLDIQKVDWLPMTEFLAWEYVRYLKNSQAAPTRAATFMEGCRFCWYILGVDGSNAIETSLRVKGMTAQMKVTKRPWLPADCLTVSEVEELHRFLEDDTKHKVDRLLAGHMLHLLYCRCRWSDLLAVQDLMIDAEGIYMELQTQTHKGAKATDMKAKLLPLVAPCMGVTSSNWAQIYVSLRESCDLHGPDSHPTHMMPAPDGDSGNKWLSRYVTSEEGADFLRALLNKRKSVGRRISTHSMKSTAISWTSKYGLSMETRAVLARHSSALSNPTVLYSRDIISSSLREFDVVLAAIRCKSFEPDRTRSGMITPSAMPHGVPLTPRPAPATPTAGGKDISTSGAPSQSVLKLEQESSALDEQVVLVEDSPHEDVDAKSKFIANLRNAEPAEDSLSETSEEDSEQSTSEEEAGASGQIPDLDRVPAFTIPISGYYINLQSSVLHCIRKENVFRCGKKLTQNFKSVWELNGIRCSRCFDV